MRRFQKYLKGRLNKPSVSPSNGWLDRNKSALELFAIWIESVGVLVAALFAIQQYASNSAAEQVNKTLSYIDRFHSEGVGNAREQFERVFDERKDEIFRISANPESETEFPLYLKRIVEEQKLEIPMTVILEFFDELNICTEANLCDEKTAVRFFGKYAWDFSGLMKPYIVQLRSEYHDPMIGMGILRIGHAFWKLQRRESSGSQ